MAEQVTTRRGFLGRVFVAALVPAMPMLGVLPGNPTVAYTHEEWFENPNDFGKVFRLIGGYNGHYASAAVAVIDPIYENPELRAGVVEEAKYQIRKYLRKKARA